MKWQFGARFQLSIFLWSINAIAILALLIWIFLDPAFVTVADRSLIGFGMEGLSHDPFNVVDQGSRSLRTVCVTIIFLLSAISWLVMLAGLMIGPRSLRSLQSWLMVVTLAGVWMAGITNWRNIARLGKQHRLLACIEEFEQLAQPLRVSWPTRDGENDGLGPYMAYPVGDPAVLILLTMPRIPKVDASICAVERGSRGQLRFQLAGHEQGDWLEWHPQGSKPSSFIGGVLDVFELDRYDEISNGWYVVHYLCDNDASRRKG